jgi:hypothetical protein
VLLGGLTVPIILLRHNFDAARIYEASIAGGQFFMISGLWMALTALIRFNLTSNWRLATAAIFWALAIGTRQSLAAPIGFIALHVGYRLAKSKHGLLTKMGNLISLGLPLTLGLLCLGWYNWARFGSITETGLYYQLAEPYIRSFYDKLFSPAYLIQNLYNYLLNPPELTPGFPFVFMAKGSINPALPHYVLPEFYNAQPITGMIFIFPFMAFAVTPLLRLLSDQFKDKRLKIMSNDLDQLPLNWVVFTLGGACLIALFLLMGFFWAGMRYAEDFMPVLTIISILGFWQGYDQFSKKKSFTKKAYNFAGVLLAALSITFSLLLAISTNSHLVNLIIHRFPFLQ